MATILKSYDWSYVSRNNKKARSRSYPWDDWFDGRIWKLEPKEDFDGPATSLERVIRTSANRRDLRVRIRIEGNSIIVQQHDDGDSGRGITKSPSQRAVKAAREAREARPRPSKPRKATQPAPSKLGKAIANGAYNGDTVRTIKRKHAKV